MSFSRDTRQQVLNKVFGCLIALDSSVKISLQSPAKSPLDYDHGLVQIGHQQLLHSSIGNLSAFQRLNPALSGVLYVPSDEIPEDSSRFPEDQIEKRTPPSSGSRNRTGIATDFQDFLKTQQQRLPAFWTFTEKQIYNSSPNVDLTAPRKLTNDSNSQVCGSYFGGNHNGNNDGPLVVRTTEMIVRISVGMLH